ncbi:MAG: hypothetical protein K8R92_02700 [Planctomycetes bacterium]|nr:hypothetical protein [Planctomycetota bacterium]
MYSVLLIICIGTPSGASMEDRFAQGAGKTPVQSMQSDAPASKDFSSKPAGSPATGAANPAPTQGNASPFQSQPAGQTPAHISPNPTPSNPPAPADAMVPLPPVSPLLSSLMRARNASISLADRQAALTDAMNEISKLPAADQARYAELAGAARQRLVVESFLSNSGQAQGAVPAQSK